MEVRSRFKGLDLIDRVPDELWNEVRDTVQETARVIINILGWTGMGEFNSDDHYIYYCG